MDEFEFQDFGSHERSLDYSATSLATAQPYESLSLPWSSSTDAFHFDPDYCYDGMLSNDHMLKESHLNWPNLQTSTRQSESYGVSDPSAIDWYALSQTNVVAPQIGHDESVVDTRAVCLGSGDESTHVMSDQFVPQQSSPHLARRKCFMDSCEFRYDDQQVQNDHMRAMHQDAFTCDECMYVGKSKYEIGLHASNTSHSSFICKHDSCEKRFARLDTYQRHQRTHREDARRFPCKYCKKYRGKNGFKRKDHLTQHVQNYHHIGEGEQGKTSIDRKWCPKKGCTDSRPAGASYWDGCAFKTPKEWVKHVRTVHDESEFSCPQPGCDRVNGKGYFRLADLRAHLRKVHGTDGSFDQSIRNDLSTSWA